MQKQNLENKSKIDWPNLIAEQETSGLSQKEFCIQRGLVFSQFVYHRCSLKNNSKAMQTIGPALKPVTIASKEAVSVVGDIRLSLPNGFQCSFPSSLDVIQIKRLVEVLISC